MQRCLGCMNEYESEYDVCPYCGYILGTATEEAFHIQPGTLLVARYLVGKVLGFGGFGVTYLGWDKLLEKKVAIKEYLPSEFATRIPGSKEITVFDGEKNEQFHLGKDKFVDEAKRLALFHKEEGIITVYDEFEENGTAYLVMEYFEGETLSSLLQREQRVSVEKAMEIILPILDALEEVHAKGIIHRDISPDNIYITNQGKIKLLDFGAARYATSNYSKSLSVILKPGFAPSEQYQSRGKQGPWSDVYALGATMYYMLTGILPPDAMDRMANDQLKPPKKLIKISNTVNNAIMNALVKDPEKRTQSAAQFKKELESEKEIALKKDTIRKQNLQIPRWAKVTGVLTSVCIVVICALLAFGVLDPLFSLGEGKKMELKEGEVYVPTVLNESTDEAITLARESGLTIQIVDKVSNDKVDANKVMKQTPEGGKIAKKGDVLQVVVSKGKEQVTVPNVQYMHKDVAERELKKVGLEVNFAYVESQDAVKDTIVSQNIEADSEYGKGGTVTLSVSKTKAKTSNQKAAVPDFTNVDLKEAVAIAREKGLYIVVSERKESSDIAKGKIITQNTDAGVNKKKGTIIEVVVSTGQEVITVPDIQYQDKEMAVSILEKAGLHVQVIEQTSDTVASGKVISQDIQAGNKVAVNTTITITVSTGTSKTNKENNQSSGNNNSTYVPPQVEYPSYEPQEPSYHELHISQQMTQGIDGIVEYIVRVESDGTPYTFVGHDISEDTYNSIDAYLTTVYLSVDSFDINAFAAKMSSFGMIQQ